MYTRIRVIDYSIQDLLPKLYKILKHTPEVGKKRPPPPVFSDPLKKWNKGNHQFPNPSSAGGQGIAKIGKAAKISLNFSPD